MASKELNEETYASILKTIWLFLENNSLQATAGCFAEEIASKLSVEEFQDVAPRTVILRPLEEQNTVDATVSDENIIICISGKQDINIDCRTTSRVLVTNNTNCPDLEEFCVCSEAKLDTTNGVKCTKCLRKTTYKQVITSVSKVAATAKDLEWLKENLERLQEDHVTLIQVATQMITALHAIEGEDKDMVLNTYKQALEDLWLYASCSDKPPPQITAMNNSQTLLAAKQHTQKATPPNAISQVDEEIKIEEFTPTQTPDGRVTPNNSLVDNVELDNNVNDVTANMSSIFNVDSLPPVDLSQLDRIKTDVDSTIKSFKTTGTNTKWSKHRVSQMSKSSTSSPIKVESNRPPDSRSLPASPAKCHYKKGPFSPSSSRRTTTSSPRSKKASPKSPPPEVRSSGKVDTHGKIKEYRMDEVNTVLDKPIIVELTREKTIREALEYEEAMPAVLTYEEPIPEELAGKNTSQQEPSVRKELEDNIVRISDVKTNGGKNRTNEYQTYQLDFQLVKKDLLEGDINAKLKLLQALRWRLTQSQPNARDHHLVCYINNDILQINMLGAAFLDTCLCPVEWSTPHPIQEEMARFLNTLSSLTMGREYLERTSAITQSLLMLVMDRFEGIQIDQLTREFLLATIQKLSLNGKIREIIISMGTVKWLAGYMLKNHTVMTNYEAEYTVALLANLCIHHETRLRCERMSNTIVNLLTVLINTPHICCQPYLPGILGSLLINANINRKAKDAGLGAKMQNLLESTDNVGLQKQLEVIISMHLAGEEAECRCEVSDEARTYVDYMEPELDLHESNYGDISGEALLEKYSILFINPEKKVHTVRKSCICGTTNKCLESSPQASKKPESLLNSAKLLPAVEEEDNSGDEMYSKMSPMAKLKIEDGGMKYMGMDSGVIEVVLNKKIADGTLKYTIEDDNKHSCISCCTCTSKAIGDDKGTQAIVNDCYCTDKKALEDTSNVASSSDGEVLRDPQQVEYQDFNSPMIIPCRLNYYYYDRNVPHLHNAIPICVPVAPVVNSKYSCDCYDSIKSMLNEDQQPTSGGRKPNNVVYGPLEPPKKCGCRMDEMCAPHGSISDAFQPRPKINRTP